MMSQVEIALIHSLFEFLGISSDKILIQEGDTINISIDVPESDAGIYIGHYAGTLDSLQTILSSMINNKKEVHQPILLDIGGYRIRRAERLAEILEAAKNAVTETGIPQALPPSLSATERRQLHLMISQDENFTSYSEGVGQARQLIVGKSA